MSNSAKSVFVFGIYISVLGIAFMIIPNALLGLFGFPATNEVWIRVAGMILFLLSYYYIQAARKEFTEFFQWTVYPRASVIVFFIVFVLLDYAPPILILFGVVDLLAAIWTHLALRSSTTT